ncbi:MAG: class I SAM-dependent methyltransferase family protein [Candidatus Bathyarchaeia archaeon]|jgi:tRNA (guanine37-N1)-methyltransferase
MKGYGIEVDGQNAQNVIRFLNKVQLVDRTLEFTRRDNFLVIPIKRGLSEVELIEICRHSSQARVVEATFSESSRKPRDLREAIEGVLPSASVDHVPRSYDIVGDIGIIELDDQLQTSPNTIANGLMKLNPHLRLVVKKTQKTSGQYRTRGVEVIAGSGSTETVHHEFSLRFHLDVASVYFNPRLSHERMRVAKQVRGGEVVVDMFAGVGPYSILIAKKQPTSRVFSIDLNPIAYKYLKENIFVNKVADRVTPLLGDAQEVASNLSGIADRVIMNFPSDSATFLDAAAKLLKKDRGVVHYYCFASRDERIQNLSDSFRLKMEVCQRKVASFSYQRVIKEVAPNRVQVALDAIIT